MDRFEEMEKTCFNPCFIGTYSITGLVSLSNFLSKYLVLILVLLELTLLRDSYIGGGNMKLCFNPCFIGTYSITRKYQVH